MTDPYPNVKIRNQNLENQSCPQSSCVSGISQQDLNLEHTILEFPKTGGNPPYCAAWMAVGVGSDSGVQYAWPP